MAKKKFKVPSWAIILVVILVVGGLSYLGVTMLLQTGEVAFEEEVATEFDFLVYDYFTGDEMDDDDHSIQIFRANIEELTDEEIEDLAFADYSLDEDKDSGESYDPDYDEYIYYCKMNGTDIGEQWFIPQLGLNTKYAVNLTEDVAMNAYEKHTLGNTINQTNADKWMVMMQTLDADDEYDATQGYEPYYDFEDDDDKYVVLRIEFNTTAQLSWCDFESSYDYNERASGNYLYYEVDVFLAGQLTLELDFGTTLGTDFEVIGMDVGHGNADVYTSWDSQN